MYIDEALWLVVFKEAVRLMSNMPMLVIRVDRSK